MGIVRRLFRRSFDQVDAYATAWEAANAAAMAAEGRLWVVLGDSAAQGVGASAHDRGWVGLVHQRLGSTWRVVNLSRSGARTREVVDAQWPRAQELEPDLVTAVVGGNDAVHTPLADWLRDAGDLVGALPPGLGRLDGGPGGLRAQDSAGERRRPASRPRRAGCWSPTCGRTPDRRTRGCTPTASTRTTGATGSGPTPSRRRSPPAASSAEAPGAHRALEVGPLLGDHPAQTGGWRASSRPPTSSARCAPGASAEDAAGGERLLDGRRPTAGSPGRSGGSRRRTAPVRRSGVRPQVGDRSPRARPARGRRRSPAESCARRPPGPPSRRPSPGGSAPTRSPASRSQSRAGVCTASLPPTTAVTRSGSSSWARGHCASTTSRVRAPDRDRLTTRHVSRAAGARARPSRGRAPRPRRPAPRCRRAPPTAAPRRPSLRRSPLPGRGVGVHLVEAAAEQRRTMPIRGP
jgi:hypothetical protein